MELKYAHQRLIMLSLPNKVARHATDVLSRPTSQVQRSCKDDIPFNIVSAFLKQIFQVTFTNDLSSTAELAQYLLNTPHCSYKRSLQTPLCSKLCLNDHICITRVFNSMMSVCVGHKKWWNQMTTGQIASSHSIEIDSEVPGADPG